MIWDQRVLTFTPFVEFDKPYRGIWNLLFFYSSSRHGPRCPCFASSIWCMWHDHNGVITSPHQLSHHDGIYRYLLVNVFWVNSMCNQTNCVTLQAGLRSGGLVTSWEDLPVITGEWRQWSLGWGPGPDMECSAQERRMGFTQFKTRPRPFENWNQAERIDPSTDI